MLNLNLCPDRIGQTDVWPLFQHPLSGQLNPLIIELVKGINGSIVPLTPASKDDAGSACKEKEGTRGMVVRISIPLKKLCTGAPLIFFQWSYIE